MASSPPWGVAATAGIGLIAGGQVEPEYVAESATKVRGAWVWISSLSGGGLLALIGRYGIPAWMEFRRTKWANFLLEFKADVKKEVLAERGGGESVTEVPTVVGAKKRAWVAVSRVIAVQLVIHLLPAPVGDLLEAFSGLAGLHAYLPFARGPPLLA